MEFTANVLTLKGFNGSPDYYVPQVVMSDGALQWSGRGIIDPNMAQMIAEHKAKNYNEA
jgi:hypothetical protein